MSQESLSVRSRKLSKTLVKSPRIINFLSENLIRCKIPIHNKTFQKQSQDIHIYTHIHVRIRVHTRDAHVKNDTNK